MKVFNPTPGPQGETGAEGPTGPEGGQGPAGNDGTDAVVENGFDERTDSTLAFDAGTRTLTITPTGAAFTFNDNGLPYSIASADTFAIPDTEGLHYIYYNGGVLASSLTFSPSLITTYAFVAVVYWDATNKNDLIFGDERHGNTMDSRTHTYNHLTFGARYASGLSLANFDIDGNGNDATAAQLSVADGQIWDEDLDHNIINGSPQTLSAIAEIPLLYMTGAAGEWRKIAATQYPVATTGTGRAAYNEYTGAVWQLSEVGNKDFSLVHFYATNDVNTPVMGIIGQDSYTTKNLARTGAESEQKNLRFTFLESLTPEIVAIGTVIVQTSNTYSNAVKSKFVSTEAGAEWVDWRSGNLVAGAPGVDGVDGADSTVAGPQGIQGETGATGADSTVAGPQGIQGVKGDTGDTGADSTVAGPQGIQGIQGIQGDTGPAGSDGNDGADSTVAGPQGEPGVDAVVGEYASFYQSTGGVTAIDATAAVTLNLSSTQTNSNATVFALAANELTVNKTATFKITADSYINNSSTARSEYGLWLEKDGVEVAGTRHASYQRGYDSGQSQSMTTIIDITSGEVLRIRIQRTDGGGTTGYQDDNGTRLTIEEK